MVLNREQAAQNAEKSTHAPVGTCQLWTRTMFDAPSVGDVDGDKDADAVDGWKSEPRKFRHANDRNAPRGTPVAFHGGSHGFGHRCISLGKGKLRSTDMKDGKYTPGTVGNCTIADIEREMGLGYLGWSESISGMLIPLPPGTQIPVQTRGPRVDDAIDLITDAKAKPGSEREKLLARARRLLLKITPVRKKNTTRS